MWEKHVWPHISVILEVYPSVCRSCFPPLFWRLKWGRGATNTRLRRLITSSIYQPPQDRSARQEVELSCSEIHFKCNPAAPSRFSTLDVLGLLNIFAGYLLENVDALMPVADVCCILMGFLQIKCAFSWGNVHISCYTQTRYHQHGQLMMKDSSLYFLPVNKWWLLCNEWYFFSSDFTKTTSINIWHISLLLHRHNTRRRCDLCISSPMATDIHQTSHH